eukprot:13933775-Alexandrium_andersonii.AAC.1
MPGVGRPSRRQGDGGPEHPPGGPGHEVLHGAREEDPYPFRAKGAGGPDRPARAPARQHSRRCGRP